MGDIKSCLGPNWIKTNVIWAPIASPTLRPSVDPMVNPMLIPTPSLTERPSGMLSEGPTDSLTGASRAGAAGESQDKCADIGADHKHSDVCRGWV
mmetsp:Transcript_15761/g.32075  ORF Transcript_15761/g.32075 Transcript_15761/m.32075 type:complete len:95 (+) Transcript_15761:428-712(+)